MVTALSRILRVFLSFYSSVLQISTYVLLTDVFFRFAGWSSKSESDRRENDRSESVRKERDWRRRGWRERDKLQQVWIRPLADHMCLELFSWVQKQQYKLLHLCLRKPKLELRLDECA